MSADKLQVGGDHYKNKAVQPWAAMESWMTFEEFIGYLRGNVIKYVARNRDKGGLEDLRKAQHYLAKLIEVEQKQQDALSWDQAQKAASTHAEPQQRVHIRMAPPE